MSIFNNTNLPRRMPSGKILLPYGFGPSASTFTMSANTIYQAMFILPNCTVQSFKFYNSGTGDNGKKLSAALYAEAASGGPGTRVINFGEATLTGAAAERTLSVSGALPGGIYYAQLLAQSTCDMYLAELAQAPGSSNIYFIPQQMQLLGAWGTLAYYANQAPYQRIPGKETATLSYTTPLPSTGTATTTTLATAASNFPLMALGF